MNERIRLLAEQAAFRQFNLPKINDSSELEIHNGRFTEQEAIEKFVNLIVRKCLERIKEVSVGEAMDVNTDYFLYDFKHHFGVEL